MQISPELKGHGTRARIVISIGADPIKFFNKSNSSFSLFPHNCDMKQHMIWNLLVLYRLFYGLCCSTLDSTSCGFVTEATLLLGAKLPLLKNSCNPHSPSICLKCGTENTHRKSNVVFFSVVATCLARR